MKKIFNTISVLLLLQTAVYAQQPAHRTSATKIADVLAQQPAEEVSKFLEAMKQLEGFTEGDVAALLSGLKPQGGNNASIEFASNSYALYVMQSGKEQLRATYVQGLLQALGQLKDANNKGYVLELLKFCAKDESVAPVSAYLSDDYLAEKAARVLSGIHSDKAAEALNQGLQQAVSEKVATAIIGAIGEVNGQGAEDRILELLQQYNSENFQRVALTTLSKVGTVKSYDVFVNKAKAVNYTFDKANAAALALNYAEHLATTGNEDAAIKLATGFYTEATGPQAIGAKVGALELLAKINPTKKLKKQLIQLTASPDPVLRNVALDLLKDQASTSEVKKLASSLKKLSPEAQESVLLFLANKNAEATIPVVEKSYKSLTDSEARIAAIKTLSVLSKGNNTGFLLAQLPKANNEEQQAIKTILLTSKGTDVVNQINQALGSADANTQLVLLEVLSQRSNPESSKVVFELMEKTTDAKVKSAAFQALPNVANDSDFEKVIELLGKAEGDQVKYAQQAAVGSLLYANDKEAKVGRLSANISKSAAPSAAKYFPIFAGEGGAVSLKTVENYLGGDNALKTPAIQALASWSNTSSLEALTKLLRTETDEKNFNVVFGGFIKQLNVSTLADEQKTLLLREAFELAKTDAQRKSALSSLKATGTYQALAFASTFLEDEKLKGVATDVVMNIATDNASFVGKDVRDWLEKAQGNLSGSESSYLKEAIVRHLAEMPSGEGYVSVFNGKDLTGWKGLVENPIKRAKMSAKELAEKQVIADKEMRETWSAANGELVFSGHGKNIATVKQYGDFEMLVDWKLDKNGKEPDAGIYLRGTPQVQIWDISRTNVGAEVGSGGLYNNKVHESKPLKVADNPLGDWNTFKIRMVEDKVWVWLNGELVVDNVTLENFWDRELPIFPMEQIELQAHGSTVWYRNIFIKELPRKQVFSLSDQEKKEGFEMLFDGTNLDKWTSTPAYEINEEGAIRANPNAKFGKNMYTKDEFGDFVYRFEFKLTPGANNGIGIRAPLEGDAAYLGYEIQVLDDDAEVYKKLAPYQYHGSVYGIIPAKRGALKSMGDWNEEEIRIQGSKIKVTLNGQVIVDGDIQEASKNGTLDKKNHPGLNQTSGHIGFLGHGSEVFYRNIRIKKL